MDNKIDWKDCDPKTVAAARALYEAYIANCGGLSWDGKPCPTWDGLNDAVRSHWCAVAIHAAGMAIAGIL